MSSVGRSAVARAANRGASCSSSSFVGRSLEDPASAIKRRTRSYDMLGMYTGMWAFDG